MLRPVFAYTAPVDEQQLMLLMAALIAAVRTARFESRDFEGMNTPRMRSEVANSLMLARLICRAANGYEG